MSAPTAVASSTHSIHQTLVCLPHNCNTFCVSFNLPRSTLAHHHLIAFKSIWKQHYNYNYNYGSSRKRVLLSRQSYSSIPGHSQATSIGNGSSAYDPALRAVLELATDSELYELQSILFGPSYFSPLLKSITRKVEADYLMAGEDLEEREDFISMLESRFLYLAADARSTLRGWRPSYRDVLLGARKRLKVPCSGNLSTEDLEVEIFLHLLQEYSCEERKAHFKSKESPKAYVGYSNLERGLSQWKIQSASALGAGVHELPPIILKGGWMLTLGNIYNLVARRLSGKMFLEAAKYQMNNDLMRKGGQLAAINIETRAALLSAKQGLVGAASRYAGLRSMIAWLGPVMWGTFVADMVIQMLGTDYARILRAIYAFAQIRIIRTYKLPSETSEDDIFLA